MNTLLINQTKEILQEEDLLASLCNVTSLLYHSETNLNWLGIYLYKKGELVLGPFQGKVACTHIPIGKGVCGTSYQKKMLLNVYDVSKFEGHIACDSNSKSELVIPLIYENKCYGVLDIDAPILSRFSFEDELIFQEVANLISKRLANR